jgi:16S rRNA (guanine1207-N2)-methyltransferase
MKLPSTVPYEEVRQISLVLGKEPIEIVTKPGLSDWDRLSPSTELLVKYSNFRPSDSVLLFGCHQAALAVYLARNLSGNNLCVTDHDVVVLEMARRTLSINQISTVRFLTDIDIPKSLYHKFDAVLMQNPKGRLLARRWLLQAYLALVEGGSLYIAGANQAGIQSAIKDAGELFGAGNILGYKKGNRVAQLIKKLDGSPLPDWASIPGIAPGTWVEFTIPFSDHTFPIHSLPGVFSHDHLDEGTKMLLSVTNIPPGARVLDVGCGYGILGLYAAIEGAGLVHLVDNNLLAVASSRETITLNHITNAEVFADDLLDPMGTNKYDLILSNPPFHTGHAVDYQIAQAMIDQSDQTLNPGGQMIIVANRFIRYDKLIKTIFGNVSTLTESGKFHVLSGLKSR